jgi:hypothetical protein
MFSLIGYLYNHIERIILGILISTTLGCTNQNNPVVSVSPKNFKVQIPFMLIGRGIRINTYWGTEKRPHVLCLDNYSPSWIKRPLIKYDKSFIKYKDHNFNTSTADGTIIQGEIGICDSLMFENITFTKVPFYVMPYNPKDDANDDGVFGIELISKGIWKIDFKKNELTFTSDIDSLQGLSQTEIFPAIFEEQSIKIDVKFENNVVKRMAVDWGYNGGLLLPVEDFNKINTANKAISGSARFSTPASWKIINSLSVFDTVNINHNWFSTIVSSGETVKERLIGLQFFRTFDYVIFDFINKRIYIPKKVW